MISTYPRILQKQPDDNLLEAVRKLHPSLSAEEFEVIIIAPEGASLTLSQVRDLRQMIQFSGARARVIIFDSFEKATTEAQNALLKVLEELGELHSFFIFTENIDSVLPTIRSRCQIVYEKNKRRLSSDDSLNKLIHKVKNGDDLGVFSSNIVQVSSLEEARSFFETMIGELQLQIRTGDRWAVEMVRYAIELLQLSKRNNLNAQLSVDAWLVRALLTSSHT